MNSPSLRALPSIDRLVSALEPFPVPRPLVVRHVRTCVEALRAAGAGAGEVPAFDALAARLRGELAALARTRLRPVINATGILAHTNLGRAPLGPAAAAALDAIARGYSNLELDLESGERGTRGGYVETGLALLCEAEAATVVNNCAAALVLILRHLAAAPRNEVVISRGELVQIGGGFRIPDVLESSGARLREVGTTNRTTIADYREVLGPQTALILRVHRSNFFMEGFVESPEPTELSALAREHGVPFVEDLGSGALVDLARLAPVEPEPRPRDILRAGADLVCFSGDKLLGGPQAGVIAGRSDLIRSLRRAPFFRALRCDKLVLAALQVAVESYLHAAARRDSASPDDVPMLALLGLPETELRARSEQVVARLDGLPVTAEIGSGRSQIGGGVCPRSSIPSVVLRLRPRDLKVDELAARLRLGSPPIIGFVSDDRLQLDLRTVPPEEDATLVTALRAALADGPR